MKYCFTIFYILFFFTFNVLANQDFETKNDFSIKVNKPNINYEDQIIYTKLIDGKISIDGDLGEEAWQNAQYYSGFFQIKPNELEMPSFKSEVAFLQDKENIYIAIKSFDPEIEKISKAYLGYDVAAYDDDSFLIFFDPFFQKTNGYSFIINANGSKHDAIIENIDNFNDNWDTIWEVKTKILNDAYFAEIKIPFRSIPFDDQQKIWGLQISRVIPRLNEEIRFANTQRKLNSQDLSNFGRLELEYLPEIKRVLDLDLSVSNSNFYNHSSDKLSSDLDFSALSTLRLSPSEKVNIVIRPNFSDSPLDNRQVNTSRFSLFQEETRAFFLEDTNIFTFGGRNFINKNGTPFFSRRIGLNDDEQIDIDAGLKYTKYSEDMQFGLFYAKTAAGEYVKEKNFLVSRLQRKINNNLKIGSVLTFGNPQQDIDSYTLGMDLQFQKDLETARIYLDSSILQAKNENNGNAFAFESGYRGDIWNSTLRIRYLSSEYNPALGFVYRNNLFEINPNFFRRYVLKDGPIENGVTGSWINYKSSPKFDLYSKEIGFFTDNELRNGNQFFMNFKKGVEFIDEDFFVGDKLLIPLGEYDYDSFEIRLSTSDGNKFVPRLTYEKKNMFDGKTERVDFSFSYKPSKFLTINSGFSHHDWKMPNGNLSINIISGEISTNISPDNNIITEFQYDNISRNFSFSSRFVWRIKPITELFIGIAHSEFIEINEVPRFDVGDDSFIIRLGHKFQF